MFKRGQAQQFNWIFIAVVGIIILLFFLGFLMKYIDLQDSKRNAEIARSFANSILTVKGTTQYKNFSVSQPFGVDYDCESLIINKDQKFRIPYSLLMDSFETNRLVFWQGIPPRSKLNRRARQKRPRGSFESLLPAI